MKLTVDRIEEDYIVCEDENKNMLNILKEDININVKEGDIFEITEDKVAKILKNETKAQIDKISKLVKGLWEN